MDIAGAGEIRPDWLIALEAALDAASEAGWAPADPIVMHGDPYIWDGEPRIAKWTIHHTGD